MCTHSSEELLTKNQVLRHRTLLFSPEDRCGLCAAVHAVGGQI